MTVSRRQALVLWIVVEHGPVSASEVGRHMAIDDGVARYDLGRLERQRLVEASYTTTARGRSYVATERGRQFSGVWLELGGE